MSLLENIIVLQSDLETLVPDIATIKFSQNEDLNSFIDEAKVYGMIKEDYRSKSGSPLFFTSEHGTNDSIDEVLENIKDLPLELYIKNKVMRLTVADIFRANQMYEEADVWDGEFLRVPLKYYIDTDGSDTVGFDEEVTANKLPRFHR